MNQSAFGRAEARVSHDRKAENEIDVVFPHGEEDQKLHLEINPEVKRRIPHLTLTPLPSFTPTFDLRSQAQPKVNR